MFFSVLREHAKWHCMMHFTEFVYLRTKNVNLNQQLLVSSDIQKEKLDARKYVDTKKQMQQKVLWNVCENRKHACVSEILYKKVHFK